MNSKQILLSAKDQSQSGGFRPVTNAQEIHKLLEAAAQNRANVTLQSTGARQKKITARMSASVPGKTLLLEELEGEKRLNGEYLMLIFLPGQAVLGLICRFKLQDAKGYWFSFPLRAFKTQRRRDARYSIPKAYEYVVHVPGGKRIVDISGRGLSFRVGSAHDGALYKVGRILKDVRFGLMGRSIVVDAEVRNCVTSPEGTKVGLRFVNISPDDADFVASFVLAHVFRTLA